VLFVFGVFEEKMDVADHWAGEDLPSTHDDYYDRLKLWYQKELKKQGVAVDKTETLEQLGNRWMQWVDVRQAEDFERLTVPSHPAKPTRPQ